MNFRHLFVLVLAASVLFACTEDENKEDCGNGKLEASEVCDGTLFKVGARVCPAGTTGDVAMITCSKSCSAVTEGVCKPIAGCNNNGILDAGEVCDGDKFAVGVRVCPAGTSGDVAMITCSKSCSAVTEGVCKPIAACNNNGVLDADEACDGDKFAAGVRVCPTGTTGEVAAITCSQSCKVITDVACKPESCTNGAQKCDADMSKVLVCQKGVWETSEDCAGAKKVCSDATKTCVFTCSSATDKFCQDDKNFVSCSMNGTDIEMTYKDCSKLGMYCDASVAGGCSSADRCVDNVLTICSVAGGCDDINCSEMAQICDATKGDCVKALSLSCDANNKVVTINGGGASYNYDCSKNTSDDIICNPKLGCTYAYCKGLDMMLCDKDECIVLDTCTKACDDEKQVCICDESEVSCKGDKATTCVGGKYVTEDCTKKNWKCSTSDGHKGCYNPDPCVENATKCVGNTYYLCIDKTWVTEECKIGSVCSAGGCIS